MAKCSAGDFRLSLLYVEDEATTREVVSSLIRRKFPNFQIYTAENGKEGLETFKSLQPDIVVADVKMPVMTGIEMARMIRSLDSAVQIIVTSAHSDMDYFIDSIEIGISRYVMKPIDKDKLLSALESCGSAIMLERLVAERSEEITRTQKLESLGVLAGGIAHDFNNILTAVIGNISLARVQVRDPEKVLQRLDDAENAAVRARDLTQQLLTFARGGEPVKKIIMIDNLLRETAVFACHGSAVRCEISLADKLWPVEADEGQLFQVINNLVINAVHAMPDGGTVSIGAENCSSMPGGKKAVKISIADSGTGIPENHVQKIFDPYFTTKKNGSGLGLATCFSIIRKHHGRITCESAMGAGSTFYVYLPAAEEDRTVEQVAEMRVVSGSGRILVMDDEEVVREIALAMLDELGYTVDLVNEGSELLALYRKRKEEGIPFSAVIMDLTIPGGMGGKQAINELRLMDPNVKAIVSSGYSTDPVMACYRDYGFAAVLMKPYRLHELGAILDKCLNCDYVPT